jgi:hypothetical protein
MTSEVAGELAYWRNRLHEQRRGRRREQLAGLGARCRRAASRAATGARARWAAVAVHQLAPAAGGAVLVSYGAAQIYSPAGWILGGVFLLIYDARH